MENDPMAFFGVLLSACISDEWKKESMLAATAISFALGIVASGAHRLLPDRSPRVHLSCVYKIRLVCEEFPLLPHLQVLSRIMLR